MEYEKLTKEQVEDEVSKMQESAEREFIRLDFEKTVLEKLLQSDNETVQKDAAVKLMRYKTEWEQAKAKIETAKEILSKK